MVDINFEAMEKAYKKTIAQYLADRIKEDNYLAEAIKKPGKTLDGTIAYIKGEAKKQAEDSVAIIPDEEVFGWAVHYILEDSLDCENKAAFKTPTELKIPHPTTESAKPVEKKPAPVAKKKARTIADEIGEQLMLFDF